MQAGVFASSGGRAAAPAFPAGVTNGNGGGIGQLLHNREFGISQGFDIKVNRERAAVSTSFGISGLTTLLALLVGLWAVDRYVLDVPGIGKGA